jgi:hypothetical protein
MIADFRGLPLQFGSDHSRERYLEEVKAARAVMKSRFEVAPRASVTLPSGKRLTEGEPVDPSMLHGSSDGTPAWLALQRMLDSGHVLEK